MLDFKGVFKVEDAKGNIKYQAIFVCHQEELLPFEHNINDEMSESDVIKKRGGCIYHGKIYSDNEAGSFIYNMI